MIRNFISFWTLLIALAAMSLFVGAEGSSVPRPSGSGPRRLATGPLPDGRGTDDVVKLIAFLDSERDADKTSATPNNPEDSSEKVKRPPLSQKLLGNTSCTAAGCHGGVRPTNGIGGEYSLWLQNDPHAKAYSVLFSDLSQRMVSQWQSQTKVEDRVPAHQAGYCLSCHSPTANSTRLPATCDGVGCEQCHGPAEQWIDRHVHPKWKTVSTAEKSMLGFRNLHDVSERARTCVECHMGINHDLIAAGHPRLSFEMSAFHANMPAHWSRESDWARHIPDVKADARPTQPVPVAELRRGRSNFEAKLWVAGQLESLHFTTKLLGTRAGHAIDNSPHMPWPELVEWNCFACHHDLNGVSWRQSRSTSTLAISKPSWNSWPLAMINFLPAAGDEKHAQSAREGITRLRDLIARPYPLPKQVYESARSTQGELSWWISAFRNQSFRGVAISSEAINELLHRMSGIEGEKLITENWDSATQVFLGLSALTHAADAGNQEAQRIARMAILNSMNETLNFPDGFDSPRSFSAEPIERLKDDLKRFHATLEAGKQ